MLYREDLGMLLLKISDNGIGCRQPTANRGLHGIREQVDSVRGTLKVTTYPDQGFHIGVDVPWPPRA